MVRVILSFFVVLALQADELDDFVSGLVGESIYLNQKSKIKAIFIDKNKFYDYKKNEPKLEEIVKILKINALMPTSLRQVENLNLTFTSITKPLIFTKTIKEALESMGYSYFLSKKMQSDNGLTLWQISLNTQYLPDPATLDEQLRKSGCKISKINRINIANWEYEINSDNMELNAKKYQLDRYINTNKPLKPYLLNVSEAKEISIKAHPSDTWFPEISFLDSNLKLINEIRQDESQNDIQIPIDELAKYAIISDKFSLDNIKRGLKIYLRKK